MDNRYTEGDLRDESVGALIKRLSSELSMLVRQELDLARVELIEKGKTVGVGAGMFSAAALVGFLALGALTAFFILALAMVMKAWLAALIVAVIYGAIAGILAMTGKQKFEEASPLTLEQTAETVKEDVQWAKTQIKSARK